MFAFYGVDVVVVADDIPSSGGTMKLVELRTIFVEGALYVRAHPPLVVFDVVLPMTRRSQPIEVTNDSALDVGITWARSDMIKHRNAADTDGGSQERPFKF
jgi:hypothetical protein